MQFNNRNELVRCEAQRYSDQMHIKTWVCHLSDYRDWDGLCLPTQASAAWVIDGAEKPYARFTLRDIAYDQPGAYPNRQDQKNNTTFLHKTATPVIAGSD